MANAHRNAREPSRRCVPHANASTRKDVQSPGPPPATQRASQHVITSPALPSNNRRLSCCPLITPPPTWQVPKHVLSHPRCAKSRTHPCATVILVQSTMPSLDAFTAHGSCAAGAPCGTRTRSPSLRHLATRHTLLRIVSHAHDQSTDKNACASPLQCRQNTNTAPSRHSTQSLAVQHPHTAHSCPSLRC